VFGSRAVLRERGGSEFSIEMLRREDHVSERAWRWHEVDLRLRAEWNMFGVRSPLLL
jgi:hypothetical protein